MRGWRGLLAAMLVPGTAWAQAVTYRVNLLNPAEDVFRVRAEFAVPAVADSFLVSLPAWTAGSYGIENYARFVHGFTAKTPEGRTLFWDKVDKDTWRIATRGPAGGGGGTAARQVVIEFETNPDSLDLTMSMIEGDFAFLNGTNLFLYPEGSDLAFPAEVVLEIPEGWRVATGLRPVGTTAAGAAGTGGPERARASEEGAGSARRYRAASYHDLVDAPVFLGRFAMDSLSVDGKTIRFAIYPESALTPAVWDSVSDAIRRIATVQNRIMGGPPYDDYTVLMYAPARDMNWGGGLEHQNSQFDALAMGFFAPNRQRGVLGEFTRPLLSHEFFHLWNVKRIRPAELWPYDYSREQFTPLLWWSEGVTDYYGDLTLARAGLWSVDRFVASMNANVSNVEQAAEIVAVEDASINTWINPTYVNESQYYYPKGALLGLMLDIQIREATGNRQSLDDVMRALYRNHYQAGRGFTTADLLGIIRPSFAGVDEFYRRYINGREALPYDAILPRGGILVQRTEVSSPYIGIAVGDPRGGGVAVERVMPGSMAAAVGLEPGDILLRVGEIEIREPNLWAFAFRARYRNSEGEAIDIVFRRGAETMTRRSAVRIRTLRSFELRRNPDPAPLARAILAGITGASP